MPCGLYYAFVFRIRQNTTGPMLCHALGNRALLLAFVVPQIWGSAPDAKGMGAALSVLGLDVVMLLVAIAGWKALRLDRA